MQLQQQKQSQKIKSLDESILVVPAATFFQKGRFQGFLTNDTDFYLNIIAQHKEFQPRALMEEDPRYKQIIPYIIFQHKEKYFVMQRAENASEVRLQNKYSLGIGGHVRSEDMKDNSIISWAKREFAEEVSYRGSIQFELLGIINDDSNAVGKVHVGFVLLAQGDSGAIQVKSELKSGALRTIDECVHLYPNMESWSKLVLDYLRR